MYATPAATVHTSVGRRAMCAALAALAVMGTPSPAAASCWESAGARYGVHPWLLAAIAKVESGFNPRAVNESHFARTGSVDLGLMQINSQWLPVLARHGITRERLFEPCTSVTVGAWILADLFARYGVTWEAIGAYNAACVRLEAAACTTRRAGYARKVEAALRELTRTAPGRDSSLHPESILPISVARAPGSDGVAPKLDGRGSE